MLQKTFPTYEQLLLPLPIWNPKAWYYGLMNLSLKTIGKLSRGIQIGFQYGFDSGVMLEYVYKNQPSGITPLGTLIDWFYLNSQGWRGIRSRSQLMKTTLRRVLQQIEQADAFNDEDLDRVMPRPNLVIVSGLHEILPNDALIKNHFQQLYRILDTSGTLIFTIQPQHPQLEMIARTLPAHTGLPWVMRVRSWELIRQWAEVAGFENFQVQMESNGIFGVVTAEKHI